MRRGGRASAADGSPRCRPRRAWAMSISTTSGFSSGSPPHAGLAIGGRGDDFDAPVGIIVEDQAHRLADHRIVIDDADPDRLGL